MYKTIILPTDLSDEETTIKTLRKTKDLAHNDHIVLLHVLDLIPSYTVIEIPDNLMKDIVRNTHLTLKRIAKSVGVEVEIEVRTGKPYRKIIQSAEENKADLIVINAHQPGLQDYLLGSTASKVVRHAKCSVLVER